MTRTGNSPGSRGHDATRGTAAAPGTAAPLRGALAALAATALLLGCATSPAPGPALPPAAPEGVAALPAWAVYTAGGEPVALDSVVAAMDGVSVVLVGEEHDDSIGHVVEAELLVRAFRRWGATGRPSPHDRAGADADPGDAGARPVVLSLEMFERDVQPVLDEYLAGLITEPHFLASVRPWERYATDYRPMVEFAKAHGIPVVAANAPRRYVNRVSRLGKGSLDALPEEALEELPPLPYPDASDEYEAQWDSVMSAAGEGHGPMPPTVLEAQSLWDAAMAHAVAGALGERPDALVLHYAGSFHVVRGTGIPEALEHYRPGTRLLVVALVADPDPRVFDPEAHAGLGDFVVLTREAPEAEDGGGGSPAGR